MTVGTKEPIMKIGMKKPIMMIGMKELIMMNGLKKRIMKIGLKKRIMKNGKNQIPMSITMKTTMMIIMMITTTTTIMTTMVVIWKLMETGRMKMLSLPMASRWPSHPPQLDFSLTSFEHSEWQACQLMNSF